MSLKVAFTSCISTTAVPEQPVWDTIRLQRPDQLVLTGDSIYIDVPWPGPHPRDMSDDAFVQHLFRLYSALLAQAQFAALVHAVPTEAIWDDHDFLWNEAYAERAASSRVFHGLVRGSRALFNAFCRAVSAQLADGSFPAAYNVEELWRPDEPPPGYRYKDLGQGVALHLTDGRSWRLRSALLGQEQRDQIAARMKALPADTVHLLASGSVVDAHKGEHWSAFDDYAWLRQLGRDYKVMVLSGDIHENRFMPLDLGGGRCLYDATASGAAVRRGVNVGALLQNHGLVEIDNAVVTLTLFSFGKPELGTPRRIDRNSWQLLA